MKRALTFFFAFIPVAAIAVACGSSSKNSGFDPNSDGGGDDDGGVVGPGGEGGFDDSGPGQTGSPTTCDGAAKAKSYIGCDYWPTVLANNVWSIFDYAVVVANGQSAPADVTVTGPNGVNQKVSVAAGGLEKIYLPWVNTLKGPDADNCGSATPLPSSVKATASAYHLVSSLPVTVFQFNALEYKGAGGPAGKSWAACPGNTTCGITGSKAGCFSFSNDASILLPSTAMTGNYRVATQHGLGSSGDSSSTGPYFAVTATQDGTNVDVQLPGSQTIKAGTGITGTSGKISFTLNAGDVAEVVTPGGDTNDLSGALVHGDKPVQVLVGTPCSVGGPNIPLTTDCDHLEESVFPAETLGKHYFVAPPTSPGGAVKGHEVRFYGNADGTHLTYMPSKPSGCPDTLNAGQMVSCGSGAILKTAFEVTGDHEFEVGSFMLSGYYQSGSAGNGGPSQGFAVAVEQYRFKYIFLAPDDYTENWVDIVAPDGTQVQLDGALVGAQATPISSGFSIIRQKLGGGQNGAHSLQADKPVGIQVVGFGSATSYQYPGGLDLTQIAPPPPPPK